MTDRKPHTPGLRRALLADTLRRPSTWAAAVVLSGFLALFALLAIRLPARIEHMRATILTTTPAETDFGTRPVMTARGENGQVFPLVTAVRQALAAPGDTVCLRVQTDRVTNRVTAVQVPALPGLLTPAAPP